MRQVAPGAGVCSGRGKETIERYLRRDFTWRGFVFKGRTEVDTYIYEPVGAADLSWRAMVHSTDMSIWTARIWLHGSSVGEKKGRSPQSALDSALRDAIRRLAKKKTKIAAGLEIAEKNVHVLREATMKIDSFMDTFGASK